MSSLDTKLQEKLRELGIPPSVCSVESLLNKWNSLTEDQRTEGYFLLSKAEEDVAVAAYSIRPSQFAQDTPKIVALRRYLSPVVSDASILDGDLNDDSALCNVAEVRRKVVGYVSYDEDALYRHIHEIVVAPRYRRQGIMSGLLASLEDGVPLSLLVHATNQSARRAFHQFGFVQKSSTPDGYLFLVKQF